MEPERRVRHSEGDLRWIGAIVLRPEPASVGRARRWFRRLAAHARLTCPLSDCELMLSELVTNAVKYGSAEGEWRIRVDWYRAGATLRVAVRNPVTAAAWPRCGATSLEGGGGRGLVIVRALADDWWSECDGRGGVLVVFEVDKAWEAADGT
ncbi:ATP-binding protein [Streptomyces buecherae]|uniref:ATP-binding protein n=1 Tax=Streptomyces buecherae TaxID=2763006 RepID=UPI0036956840